MNNKLVSGLITLAVVFGGIGFLFYSSQGEAFEYYKHVDEMQREVANFRGKHLQVHGFVQPGSIMQKLDREHQQMEYKFIATNCGATVTVKYSGLVPDTFKDKAEVVIKGTLVNDDLLVAQEISAKCPSKYESRPGTVSAAETMCTKGDKQSDNAAAVGNTAVAQGQQ